MTRVRYGAVAIMALTLFIVEAPIYTFAQVFLNPNPFTFSPLGVGSQSPTKFLRVTNTGNTVHISSININGDFQIQNNGCGNTIPPNSTCHLSIDFTPTMLGSRTGTVTIMDDAPNSPQTATLKGTGVPPVTIGPSAFTFHDELSGANSAPKSFSVFNNSSSPVSVSKEGTTGDFQIVSNFCGVVVLPPFNGVCGVNIVFAPQQVGKRTGTLVITDNAPNNPQIANLSGNSVTISTLHRDAFTGVFPLNIDRGGDTLTLLNNGKVLVAGGGTVNQTLNSAELYDPATGKFTLTGKMSTARSNHAATLLPNGKVLITGGSSNTGTLRSAELYDPASGKFSLTGPMTMSRLNHGSTLLDTGQVLITGGGTGNVPSTAEVYDPKTGTFTAVGNMNFAREEPSATLLNNGKVLILGSVLDAELYDPVSQTFSVVGPTEDIADAAALLNDAEVLINVGSDRNTPAQLYDPVTNMFLATGELMVPRRNPTVVLLPNGAVLFAGGVNQFDQFAPTTELYDPPSGKFHGGPSVGFSGLPSSQLPSKLLANAEVLATGFAESTLPHDAEIYFPSAVTPAGLVSITVTPANGSIATGAAQKFIAMGMFSDNSVQQLSSVTWGSSNNAVATIANDNGSRGWAFGVSPGMVTITAHAGKVAGSTTLTVH